MILGDARNRVANTNKSMIMGHMIREYRSNQKAVAKNNEGEYCQLVKTLGISLPAGVFTKTNEPDKLELESLWRCVSRPAM
jgi:hypothetical protein